MMVTFRGLMLVSLIAVSPLASAVNLLNNPGFDEAPILGSGQSDVGPGETKMIVISDSIDPIAYQNAIWGIPGWLYWLPDGISSDHGISRDVRLTPISGERFGFINNWNRRMSQVTSHLVQVGDVIHAEVWVGSHEPDARASRVSLFAGYPGPVDFDQFAPETVVLSERTAANAAWTTYTPDVLLPGVGWSRVVLDYTVGAGDPAIGKTLGFGFRTEDASVGPVFYDAALLEVVPEPASMAALVVGVMAFLRARRR